MMNKVVCWKCNECSKDMENINPCMLSTIDASGELRDNPPAQCPFNSSNDPEWFRISGVFEK